MLGFDNDVEGDYEVGAGAFDAHVGFGGLSFADTSLNNPVQLFTVHCINIYRVLHIDLPTVIRLNLQFWRFGLHPSKPLPFLRCYV